MGETEWPDRAEYPFASRFFRTAAGRMHFVDEGEGETLVFVHGTPTWSFLYRRLIRGLRGRYRCIAMDHIGFGLSDKPEKWTYRPEDHAANLAALLEHLRVDSFSLVAHDLGGPIALAQAVENPGRVGKLALFNTFFWPFEGKYAIPPAGKLLSGALGRFLYLRLNFSPRFLLPMAYGDRRKLTPEIHRHYLMPFSRPGDRQGAWGFARELSRSGPWFSKLWERRRALEDKPLLILWGLKDPAFTPKYLERWRQSFPAAEVRTFADAGHFVMEEKPAECLATLEAFLGEGVPAPG